MQKNNPPRLRRRSFFTSVALMTAGVMLVLIVLLVLIARTQLRSIYENDYNKRIMDINAFVTTQVDGDKVEQYAETLEKDDYYFQLIYTLYQVREIFDVEYVYIMVDNGVPGQFTYVFDAVYDEKTRNYDDSNFGTTEAKDSFPGGQDVLDTGRPFPEARFYSSEEYRTLYYAYSPVFNSRGKVVAFLGTDIDASPMFNALARFDRSMIFLSTGVFLVVSLFLLLYGKFKFSNPIRRLTGDVIGISHGKLETAFSEKILARKDELGEIYRAFQAVSETISHLVKGMQEMSTQMLHGKLSARVPGEGRYQGSYARLLESANMMLENNCKIWDMVPCAVVFYDDRFNTVYQNNPSALRYSAPEEGGCGPEACPSGLDALNRNQEAIHTAYRAFVAGGEKSSASTLTFLEENGQRYDFNLYFIRTETGQEGEFMVCAVFTDVSEYVEMSERAQASSRAKSEFLSRMSHELRTPMNAIMGMAEVARRHTDDPQTEKQLGTIETSAAHLLTIINDVLDISKIEAGNLELNTAAFNLPAMLEDVLSILAQQAATHGVRLRLETEGFSPAQPLCLLGDEARLRQVVINLISNAIKFSPEGGEVILRVCAAETPNGTALQVSVQDFGIGVPEESQDKIFEAFEQGGGDIARRFGGTGLGLPISQRIIRLMGGDAIHLRSTPGKGSTFSFGIRLPNAPQCPERGGPGAETPHPACRGGGCCWWTTLR